LSEAEIRDKRAEIRQVLGVVLLISDLQSPNSISNKKPRLNKARPVVNGMLFR